MSRGSVARSWKSSIPSASRPCRLVISPCSASCFSVTAVDDMAIAPPMMIAGWTCTPVRTSPAATSAIVMPTCRLPATSTSRRARENRRNREFEADHEHEEDQAEFREKARILGGVDQIEAMRPECHADEQVAHDGRHPQRGEDAHRQARRREEDQGSGQQEIVHCYLDGLRRTPVGRVGIGSGLLVGGVTARRAVGARIGLPGSRLSGDPCVSRCRRTAGMHGNPRGRITRGKRVQAGLFDLVRGSAVSGRSSVFRFVVCGSRHKLLCRGNQPDQKRARLVHVLRWITERW